MIDVEDAIATIARDARSPLDPLGPLRRRRDQRLRRRRAGAATVALAIAVAGVLLPILAFRLGSHHQETPGGQVASPSPGVAGTCGPPRSSAPVVALPSGSTQTLTSNEPVPAVELVVGATLRVEGPPAAGGTAPPQACTSGALRRTSAREVGRGSVSTFLAVRPGRTIVTAAVTPEGNLDQPAFQLLVIVVAPTSHHRVALAWLFGIAGLLVIAVVVWMAKRKRSTARDAVGTEVSIGRGQGLRWLVAIVALIAIGSLILFAVPGAQPRQGGRLWDHAPFHWRLGLVLAGIAAGGAIALLVMALRGRVARRTIVVVGLLIAVLVWPAAANMTWKPSVPDVAALGKAQFLDGEGLGVHDGPPSCRSSQRLQADGIWPLRTLVGRFANVHADAEDLWEADLTTHGGGVPVYEVHAKSFRYLVAVRSSGCFILYYYAGQA